MEPYIFIIAGILFLVFANIYDRKHKTLLKLGKQAEGVVTDIQNAYSARKTAYFVIRFATDKQQWLTEKADIYYAGLKIGDKLTVVYDPENPENFTIKSKIASLLPTLFMIIGALLIIAGISLLLFPQLLDMANTKYHIGS